MLSFDDVAPTVRARWIGDARAVITAITKGADNAEG